MGLQENLNAETVRSLPLRNPVTVSLESTLNEVVEQMQSRRLGCAVVIATRRQTGRHVYRKPISPPIGRGTHPTSTSLSRS